MRHDSGIALVKVLIFTSILFVVAAYASRGTRTELRIANNDYLGKRAVQVAEAGLDRTWRQIEQDVNAGGLLSAEAGGTSSFWTLAGWTTDTTTSNSTIDCTVAPYCRFFSFGGTSADGYDVKIDHASDDPTASDSVRITALGMIGNSRRTIQAMLEKTHALSRGLFGKYWANLNGGGTTDSYDSSLGTYASQTPGSEGDVGSNGDITNNGTPTTVNGDEYAGGTIAPGSATITGGLNDGQSQVGLQPVAACSPNSTGTGITPPADYNSGSGRLRGNSSDNIVLAAGTYCFDSITLNGNSTLTVSGAVTIYLRSTTDLTGGGVINTTGVPSNLQIYSSQVSTGTNAAITVNGGSQVAMVIYAPEANIKITGGSDFYGAVVGGSIKLTGGTSFHYDTQAGNVGPWATQLVSWHQIQG